MEIETLQDLTHQADAYRQVFNHIRPHEALAFYRPIEVRRKAARQFDSNADNNWRRRGGTGSHGGGQLSEVTNADGQRRTKCPQLTSAG